MLTDFSLWVRRGCFRSSLLDGLGGVVCDLGFYQVVWSVTGLVHWDFSFGVNIDSQADLVFVKIVDRVKVAKESISDQKQIFIFVFVGRGFFIHFFFFFNIFFLIFGKGVNGI